MAWATGVPPPVPQAGLRHVRGGRKTRHELVLDATARYTRVATGMTSAVESPLDLLTEPRRKPNKTRTEQPPAA